MRQQPSQQIEGASRDVFVLFNAALPHDDDLRPRELLLLDQEPHHVLTASDDLLMGAFAENCLDERTRGEGGCKCLLTFPHQSHVSRDCLGHHSAEDAESFELGLKRLRF
jgi:hypothetical protein